MISICVFPTLMRCAVCGARQWIRATPFGYQICCYAEHDRRRLEVLDNKTADLSPAVRQIRAIELPSIPGPAETGHHE